MDLREQSRPLILASGLLIEAVHGSFQADVAMDLQQCGGRIRVKHSVKGNSLKAHSKACKVMRSVPRAEATLNRLEEFKVHRRRAGRGKGPRARRRCDDRRGQ